MVIVGEGTTIPFCLIAFGLHEVVEGIQFARDLQDACDKDVGSVEAHATFGNIYRLHDDLVGVSSSSSQNATTTVNAVDASAAALAAQINTQSSAIIQEVDGKAAQVIGIDDTNRDTIVGNDNTNRETIVITTIGTGSRSSTTATPIATSSSPTCGSYPASSTDC